MIALLAFVSAAATQPHIETLLSPTDYPQWAAEQNQSAAALIEAVIDPDGKVIRCNTVQQFGSRELADQICNIVLRKRMPGPHTSGKGFCERALVRFFLPETSEGLAISKLQQPPDFVFAVNQLPNDQTSLTAEVNLMVDQNGQVTDCVASSPNTNEAAVNAICSMRDQLGATKMVDSKGQPFSYVLARTIQLTVQESQTNSAPR
jgi:hypothetical protein